MNRFLLNVLVLIGVIEMAITLKCWTCTGFIPSNCSRTIPSESVQSVECPEGDTFTPVCIVSTPRGFTFQNRSQVERSCERQYLNTNICARRQERFNTTACRLCNTTNCNSNVANDDGTLRNSRSRLGRHRYG